MSVKITSVNIDKLSSTCTVTLNWKRFERDTGEVEGTGASSWGNVQYNNVSLNLFVRNMSDVPSESLKDINTGGFKYFGWYNSQYHYNANDFNNVVCENITGDNGLWKAISNGLNFKFGEVTTYDFQKLSINTGDITADELECALGFADSESANGIRWVTPETPSFFPLKSVRAYGIYYDFYSWGISHPTLYSGCTNYLINQVKNADSSIDFTVQIPWNDSFELGNGKYYISVVETYLHLFRLSGSTLTASYSDPWDVINSANIVPDPEYPEDQFLFTSGDAYTVNTVDDGVMDTYPNISNTSVPLWDWHSSNGSATAAETASAYNAIMHGGLVSDFSSEVFNDLVKKVYSTLNALGSSWTTQSDNGASYFDYDETLMTASEKTLLAKRFNSLRFNIGSRSPTGINDKSPGDLVEGIYFIILADALNSLINDNLS